MTAPTAGQARADRDGEEFLPFPKGFVWGAGTSAHQIEGATDDDGRGPSIWDTFARVPGAVDGGDTGQVACDHYRRWAGDVALMAELGLRAYRFSVAWPRIQPEGRGPALAAGLGFYDRLADALLARGIEPAVTLYHWDLPQALQDRGGWPVRDTAGRFADYAALVGARLGDRVRRWTTINEPWCPAFLGYGSGLHAPGIRDAGQALRAAHHLMLAHGRAVRVLQEQVRADAEVSITLNLQQAEPAPGEPGEPGGSGAAGDSREEDAEAARRVDGVANRIFLDPLFRGRYPDDVLEATRELTSWSALVRDGDLAEISAPVGSLGLNYYAPLTVRAGSLAGGANGAMAAFPGCADIDVVQPVGPRTGMGWEVAPAALTRLLLRVSRDVPGVPLVVTENGGAYPDVLETDGRVRDPQRIGYLRDHLAAVHAALSAGADVRGYYAWSLLDNFEWSWGYAQRFGLVYVDYGSGDRVPKDSAHWYRDVITRGGVSVRPADVRCAQTYRVVVEEE